MRSSYAGWQQSSTRRRGLVCRNDHRYCTFGLWPKTKTEAIKVDPATVTSTAIKTAAEAAEIERCTPPSFANMMEHEDK